MGNYNDLRAYIDYSSSKISYELGKLDSRKDIRKIRNTNDLDIKNILSIRESLCDIIDHIDKFMNE